MDDEYLKVLDPARWEAKQKGRWLAKEYHYDLGCTETKMSYTEAEASKFWLSKWIQERLEAHRDPEQYYYILYDPQGVSHNVNIHWRPQITI